MKTLLAIVLIIIFLAIALVHFYWALGGKKWASLAIPKTNENETLFKPSMIETLVVAVAFLGFGYIMACEAAIFSHQGLLVKYGSWAIPAVFIVRAIGEFRYVGFFKKIKNTDFGQMDSKYYSPLCLAIGIIGLIIKLL
jgi:Protein of unknown function (DUF3995)